MGAMAGIGRPEKDSSAQEALNRLIELAKGSAKNSFLLEKYGINLFSTRASVVKQGP